jgi:hypothetical protein
MKPIATILAATDFSPDGNNAVHRAALLAQQLGARLKPLHAVDSTRFRKADCDIVIVPRAARAPAPVRASPFANAASVPAGQRTRSAA